MYQKLFGEKIFFLPWGLPSKTVHKGSFENDGNKNLTLTFVFFTHKNLIF